MNPSQPSHPITAEDPVQERIARSAERLFRTFGYTKTTVADVAADVGISTAYVYRFYPSKIAICERVCSLIIDRLTDALWREARSTLEPEEKLQRLFTRLAEETLRLLFEEKRLLEIVRVGLDEDWPRIEAYVQTLSEVASFILEEGVARGRFRLRQPLTEAAEAIAAMLMVSAHPVLVNEARNKDPVRRAKLVAALALSGIRV
jgi:AcrR family transcriptional regulator